jgi:hypothetical protein
VTEKEMKDNMSGSDIDAIKALHDLLKNYNASGECEPLGIPEGNENLTLAKSWAHLEFANCN